MTIKNIGFVFVLCLILMGISLQAKDSSKPKLMLANVYHEGIDLTDYWVSEKYDGVRALWTGDQFVSRGGNIYHAPDWFTNDFPIEKLDGELWISRQNFELLVSTVRDRQPDNDAWKKVKFMVFDVPEVARNFDQRIPYLNRIVESVNTPWLKAVKQFKVKNHVELMTHLDLIIAKGAEGLMLHKGSSLYRAKRSGDLLKVKSFEDAEAIVVEHISGKGKYESLLGAILVQTKEGKRFKIGSGFTDSQRRNPPEIGSIITYRFRGKTKNNIPRFASFLRIRTDKDD